MQQAAHTYGSYGKILGLSHSSPGTTRANQECEISPSGCGFRYLMYRMPSSCDWLTAFPICLHRIWRQKSHLWWSTNAEGLETGSLYTLHRAILPGNPIAVSILRKLPQYPVLWSPGRSWNRICHDGLKRNAFLSSEKHIAESEAHFCEVYTKQKGQRK